MRGDEVAVNKVIYNGATLVDLTGDTVTEDVLQRGYTAHRADGTCVTGNLDLDLTDILRVEGGGTLILPGTLGSGPYLFEVTEEETDTPTETDPDPANVPAAVYGGGRSEI